MQRERSQRRSFSLGWCAWVVRPQSERRTKKRRRDRAVESFVRWLLLFLFIGSANTQQRTRLPPEFGDVPCARVTSFARTNSRIDSAVGRFPSCARSYRAEHIDFRADLGPEQCALCVQREIQMTMRTSDRIEVKMQTQRRRELRE